MTLHRPPPRAHAAVPIVLRDAAPDDAERLGALHVQCWTETYSGLVDPQILAGLSVGDRTAGWRRQIDALAATGRILVLENGPDLIGFGTIGAQRHGPLARQGYDGEIHALYLRRDWQGLGLGRRLFEAQCASLAARGFRAATLWVLSGNRRARGFYERMDGRPLDLSLPVPSLGGSPEIAYGWRDHQLAGLLSHHPQAA